MRELKDKKKKNSDKNIIKQFFVNKKKAMKNPLIYNFLEHKRNKKLVENAILCPTKYNRNLVEIAFRKHYEKVVKIKYISSLIHFYSIDYDRKIRKIKGRFILTLDKDIFDDEKNTLKDLIKSERHIYCNLFNTSLFDITDNKDLIKGLESLTKNQLLILELVYLKEFQIKEIANILDTTPQNISNQHRKSLKKLYKHMGDAL